MWIHRLWPSSVYLSHVGETTKDDIYENRCPLKTLFAYYLRLFNIVSIARLWSSDRKQILYSRRIAFPKKLVIIRVDIRNVLAANFISLFLAFVVVGRSRLQNRTYCCSASCPCSAPSPHTWSGGRQQSWSSAAGVAGGSPLAVSKAPKTTAAHW